MFFLILRKNAAQQYPSYPIWRNDFFAMQHALNGLCVGLTGTPTRCRKPQTSPWPRGISVREGAMPTVASLQQVHTTKKLIAFTAVTIRLSDTFLSENLDGTAQAASVRGAPAAACLQVGARTVATAPCWGAAFCAWQAHSGMMAGALCFVPPARPLLLLSFVTSPAPSRPVAYLCLAASMSMVGCYMALSKPLAAAIPVLLLAWLRFGIAAVVMLPWLRKTAAERPLDGPTRRLLFLESFFGNFLFTLCMVTGVSLTSAVSAGVIMAAIPAAVAVFSRVFLREKARARTWWAIALAVAGIALLALAPAGHSAHPAMPADGSGLDGSTRNLLGHVLLVAAVLCEAAYAVIGKKLTAALPPKRITAIINLWGLALATPWGLYTALQFDFAAVHRGIWWLLLLYALAASTWTVWLWMTGLRTVPASQSGVFTVLLPVSAALTGVLVLGESLQALQALALGIALCSVLVATVPLPRWTARRG